MLVIGEKGDWRLLITNLNFLFYEHKCDNDFGVTQGFPYEGSCWACKEKMPTELKGMVCLLGTHNK